MKATRGYGSFLAAVLPAFVLIAAACGSDATSTTAPTSASRLASPTETLRVAPTLTPTEVTTPILSSTEVPTSVPSPASAPSPEPLLFNPQSFELTQTQVFAEFPFSIDYPKGWTVEFDVPATFISQFSEDSPRRGESYGVSLDHRDLTAMYAMGLPEKPTLEDLLHLNNTFFGWAVLDVSETTTFGAPALMIEAKRSQGVVSAVMGFVDGEAYLLIFAAPTREALNDFKSVWARMLDSIRPAELATTAGEEYFEEVRTALDLAGLRFAKVSRLLGQSYPTRERVIEALLEGGAGTVFTATVETLSQIEPPSKHEEGHRRLVEAHREFDRNDREVGVALEEGNLVRFGLLSGQSAELRVALITSLPPEYCHGLFPRNDLCSPLEPLPGGEYGEQLNGLLRQFEPQFAGAGATVAFPLSLGQSSFSALPSRWPLGWSR